MSAWTRSLPQVGDPEDLREHGELAIMHLRIALRYERTVGVVLADVQMAAAHVRAWRKALPKEDQSIKHRLYYGASERALIGEAIGAILDADLGYAGYLRPGDPLRVAESLLRTLGEQIHARNPDQRLRQATS